jgi:hypothetical protein
VKRELEDLEEKEEEHQQNPTAEWGPGVLWPVAVAEAISDGHVFQFFAFLPVSSPPTMTRTRLSR